MPHAKQKNICPHCSWILIHLNRNIKTFVCFLYHPPKKNKHSSLELGAVRTRCFQDQQGYGTAAKDGGERGSTEGRKREEELIVQRTLEDVGGFKRKQERSCSPLCVALSCTRLLRGRLQRVIRTHNVNITMSSQITPAGSL